MCAERGWGMAMLEHTSAANSVRSLSACSVCSLPPCGGGLGRGVMRVKLGSASREGIALPPPLTPPHKGEGNAPSLRSERMLEP